MGLDLGQSQDFTAIAALERAELVGEWAPVMFAWRKTTAQRLRHLERVSECAGWGRGVLEGEEVGAGFTQAMPGFGIITFGAEVETSHPSADPTT